MFKQHACINCKQKFIFSLNDDVKFEDNLLFYLGLMLVPLGNDQILLLQSLWGR
jgi:predicted nucleotide-binding protein